MGRFQIDPRVIADVVFFLGASTSVYYIFSLLFNQASGPDSMSKETKQKATLSIQKLKEKNPGLNLDLNNYEKLIISNLITPTEINVTFDDIGGLDDIVEELREAVLYPLTVPQLYSQNDLLQAPKGVLLYGPPGCGKTMIAKALASESHANFLNIRMSTLMDKFYGESNKLVSAIFSLANKLQPCIIFIDEIDSFLRERQSSDEEITSMLKAEFMTLWDGLVENSRTLILGATNRPYDIDSAILRRMPKRFAVSLPAKEDRERILRILLKSSVLEEGFDYEVLSEKCVGMSGSDLKEACRNALMIPMREFIKTNFKNGHLIHETADDVEVEIRPLRMSDFFVQATSDSHMATPKNDLEMRRMPVD